MENRIIELRDVGPIENLRIHLPESGLVVLRARNGRGKTHALDAVSALVGGKGRVPTRDGSIGAQVEGLGARLTIGRRSSHSGEVEIAHLEGEDPSLLVDPGVKSQDAADAARIRALLRLSRAEVSADAFAGLVGGRERLEELCRPSSLDAHDQDVPAMAAAIKRDLEAAARKAESARDNALSRADGVRDTISGMSGEGAGMRHESAEDAQEAHTRAVREHEALKTQQRNAAAMLSQAREAREVLRELGDDGTDEKVKAWAEDVQTCDQVVEEARRRLADAEEDARAARRNLERQKKARAQRGPLQRAVDAAADVREVPDSDVEAMAEAVAAAHAELGEWAVYEKTARLREQVAELDKSGKAHGEEAALLRNAASGTEAVVVDAVRSICGDGFEISEGRLYVQTDRGRELFSDLSHGERWRMALDVAVAAVGKSGLLVVRQEAYESLDPGNRREIAEHAKRLGVVGGTVREACSLLLAQVETKVCNVGGVRGRC